MNASKNDSANSIHYGNYVTFVVTISAEIFLIPFYVCWIVYFLSEVFYLRRKIRGLLYRGSSSETDNLLYKTRGYYYTYILMVVIAILEPLTLVPASLGLIPVLYESTNYSMEYEYQYQQSSDIMMYTYVLSLIAIFLWNTLTIHLIRVCRSDTRIQLLPPIQHRLIILTSMILLLAIIKLAIEDFDVLIIEVSSNLLINYEYICLCKNSKQLYNLLKWRYQDLRYEQNYPLYKAHRRIAVRYKYVTISLLSGVLFQILAGWLHTLSLLILIIKYHISNSLLLIYLVFILKWISSVISIIGFSPLFIVVGYTLYNLAAVCLNKIGCSLGRNRISFVQEPLLQH